MKWTKLFIRVTYPDDRADVVRTVALNTILLLMYSSLIAMTFITPAILLLAVVVLVGYWITKKVGEQE